MWVREERISEKGDRDIIEIVRAKLGCWREAGSLELPMRVHVSL